VKPGQKPFMCLDELNDICKMLNLYNEEFVERDMNFAFNLSMMTRIAEKRSLAPYGTEVNFVKKD